jgi:hypothetical protein
VRVVAALCALTVAAVAGCDDLFVLPLPLDGGGEDARDLSTVTSPDLDGGGAAPDGFALDGGGFTTDGGLVLPTACALLPCTPAMLEGDVQLSDGNVSGCRAFRTLTISGMVNVDKDGSGDGLHLCAERIVVAGILSAVGRGLSDGMGPGAGKLCGSGGSHGGLGDDPGMCGRGVTYGDANTPRTHGSGGGSFSGGGGAGGGAIELVAGEISFVLGIVAADGAPGSSALAGGGAGGSVLLRALRISGTGQVTARGGIAIAGGGGGGGRIAAYGIDPASSITLDADGAASSGGADGTVVRSP